jgi:NADH-quinone oxidoreductase subunit M
MIYRTFFGPLDRDENRTMKDLDFREVALLVPLAVLMVWLGLGPKPLLDRSEPAVRMLLETVDSKRAALEIRPDGTPGLVYVDGEFRPAPTVD